ncbi:TM2 domain-containing protein [Clostridium sp. N3C]|uniref:TM2 domain-containing protein n=1 Tax=Clostridium sp. N3C TaxID=1776758 RepID=UPI00092E0CC1|nr:TM2 domain-containing protein [Clostridium sp. N3C]SCN23182.1 TM2 domain-containing protein [Clostridium sp. N3C]
MEGQFSGMNNSNEFNQSVQNQYMQNSYTNGQGQNMNNFDMQSQNLKFCKFCGEKIPMDAVICVKCGRQVEELKTSSSQPNIVINNDNSSRNTNVSAAFNMGNQYMYPGTPKSKLTALLLCLFLGVFGAHKFYEGKVGMGLLYIFTLGLCGFGVFIDFIRLLFRPSIYYV